MGARHDKAILSVGRSYCDLIFTGLPRAPSQGTEVFAEGLSIHAGGGAAITAAHLSALGRRAMLATTLPAAPFRDAVELPLREAGIDLTLSRAAPYGSDPQVTVALSDAGDRSFITRRAGAAAPPLSPGHLGTLGIGHIHIGELGTLLEMPELLPLGRTLGATLSLDCGWDDGLDLAQAAPLIAQVDVFLPNAAEQDCLRKAGLAEPVCPLTVIKQGAQGAEAVTAQGTRVTIPATPAQVVDTTGAGDAFNAGFLDAWLQGAEVPNALSAGAMRGAAATGHVGGFANAPQQARTAELTAP